MGAETVSSYHLLKMTCRSSDSSRLGPARFAEPDELEKIMDYSTASIRVVNPRDQGLVD